ncbi:hypothetical protein D3C87_621000 [compost metagenome]|uniref:STM3941 family protein n=1 Tax=Pedobacter sp. ok626 TaxID=1761882 RepID=UPI0008898D39|nr:STM3941 family protein [Pedobacter sp. ok626]SDL15312.1 hypothetical protein SAMN04487898_115133 [Pedobacter sp. ok626]
MSITNPVIIPFSKSKNFLLLIGANSFVGIGCWLLFANPTFENQLLVNSWFTKTIGAASIVFFGFASYFLVRNLMANGPGLMIDDSGIINYSSASGIKIYWKDIQAIEVLTIKSQPIILFKVSNPQTYINRETNRFKRKMMALNYKWYGAPVSISANGLQISFQKLLQLVSDRLEVYTNNN